MDRGAQQATGHGVARVGDDLATKPPPHYKYATTSQWLNPREAYIYIA